MMPEIVVFQIGEDGDTFDVNLTGGQCRVGAGSDADIDLSSYLDTSYEISSDIYATIEQSGRAYTILEHENIDFIRLNGQLLTPNQLRVLRIGDHIEFGRLLVIFTTRLASEEEYMSQQPKRGANKASRLHTDDNVDLSIIIKSMTNYAMRSFGAISKGIKYKGKNLLYSPYSAYIVLSFLYNGAGTSNSDAIAEVMDIEHLTLEELNTMLSLLSKATTIDDPKVTIESANKIEIAEKIIVRPDYMDSIVEKFKIELTAAENPREMLLINNINFEGQWKSPFEPDLMETLPFYVTSGDQQFCQMMYATDRTCWYFHGETYQAIRLAYGADRIAMYLFLPEESITLDDFIHSLTDDVWTSTLANMVKAEGDIHLQEFTFDCSINLNDSLISLGMAESYEYTADWSLLTNNPAVRLNYVKQKAHIEVDAEGTIASVTTWGSARFGSSEIHVPKFSLQFNRPFFYAIHDDSSGVIHFMGTVTDPTQD
jgi:serine protease inhibitor